MSDGNQKTDDSQESGRAPEAAMTVEQLSKVAGFSHVTAKVHRRYVMVVEVDVEADTDFDFGLVQHDYTDALDSVMNYELLSVVPLDWDGTLASHNHRGVSVRRYRKVVSRVMHGTEL